MWTSCCCWDEKRLKKDDGVSLFMERNSRRESEKERTLKAKLFFFFINFNRKVSSIGCTLYRLPSFSCVFFFLTRCSVSEQRHFIFRARIWVYLFWCWLYLNSSQKSKMFLNKDISYLELEYEIFFFWGSIKFEFMSKNLKCFLIKIFHTQSSNTRSFLLRFN